MSLRRFAAPLALTIAACTGALPDDPLGTTADPEASAYCIASARVATGSVHFVGLPWLLDAAEGAGPITLGLDVGVFVQPTVTSTVSGLAAKDVSAALGQNFLSRYDVIATSTTTLPSEEISRIEAYTAFQETAFEVKDAACGNVLGTGAAFIPSGVFFQTVHSSHAALPDATFFGYVPGCESLYCAPGVVPGTAGGPPGSPSGAGGSGAETAVRLVPGFVPTPTSSQPTPGFRPF